MRVVLLILGLLTPLTAFASETMLIRGAGPSTKIVELFFQHFSSLPEAKAYQFVVEPKSIKHVGGIKAAESAVFARSGRPLTEEERNLGKYEILLAKAPISIVVGSKVGVKKLSIGDLARIYGRKVTNWSQLGGADHPIFLVGRESGEAAFSEMKKHHAFMRKVKFDKVFTKDHQVNEFITSDQGAYAIAFGSRANFDPKYQVRVLGFTAGVELGLIYDQANVGHPLVMAAKRYAESDDWRRVLLKNRLYPPMK